jgi:hypothetical protein
MKHSRERRKQDGRWPQVPSARKITVSLPGSVPSFVCRRGLVICVGFPPLFRRQCMEDQKVDGSIILKIY